MPVSKIPASYHLKQMLKSDDIGKVLDHYFAFWFYMYRVQYWTLKQYQKAFGIE